MCCIFYCLSMCVCVSGSGDAFSGTEDAPLRRHPGQEGAGRGERFQSIRLVNCITLRRFGSSDMAYLSLSRPIQLRSCSQDRVHRNPEQVRLKSIFVNCIQVISLSLLCIFPVSG